MNHWLKTLHQKKGTVPDGFAAKFQQTLKAELAPILFKVFQKTEQEGTCTALPWY